jgi:hypothetical protein
MLRCSDCRGMPLSAERRIPELVLRKIEKAERPHPCCRLAEKRHRSARLARQATQVSDNLRPTNASA